MAKISREIFYALRAFIYKASRASKKVVVQMAQKIGFLTAFYFV
jgi:hypothetical protein